MPRKLINDYVFYKLVCNDRPDLIYIGSTANFKDRKSSHKRSCNNPNDNEYNSKKYTTIREHGGWDNWQMVVIDEAKELTLLQSRIKEEELRIKYEANLNTIRAFLSEGAKKEYKKEWVVKNKDHIKELKKEYRENNRDHIKKYREMHKEQNKEYGKKYREMHKEQTKEYNKKYREKNKDRINEQKRLKYRQAKEQTLL